MSQNSMPRAEGQLVDIVDDQILRSIILRKPTRKAQIGRIDDSCGASVISLWNCVDLLAKCVGQLQKESVGVLVLQLDREGVVVGVSHWVAVPCHARVLREWNECLTERDCCRAQCPGQFTGVGIRNLLIELRAVAQCSNWSRI